MRAHISGMYKGEAARDAQQHKAAISAPAQLPGLNLVLRETLGQIATTDKLHHQHHLHSVHSMHLMTPHCEHLRVQQVAHHISCDRADQSRKLMTPHFQKGACEAKE